MFLINKCSLLFLKLRDLCSCTSSHLGDPSNRDLQSPTNPQIFRPFYTLLFIKCNKISRQIYILDFWERNGCSYTMLIRRHGMRITFWGIMQFKYRFQIHYLWAWFNLISWLFNFETLWFEQKCVHIAYPNRISSRLATNIRIFALWMHQ